MHHVALTQEQRGRLLARLGRNAEASRVLEEAARRYQRWGAQAKATRLESERHEPPHRFTPTP